jgi:hypothetical protein
VGALGFYSFSKNISSIRIRGFLICALLIPICLFADFLMWSFKNGKNSGFPQFFSLLGSIFVTFITGITLGAFLSFQGVYISACSKPGSYGITFGLFWGTIPLVHLYSSMLSSSVFDPGHINI